MAGLTLTIAARITANYGEGLGNVANIQKVFIDGQAYAARTKESLKYAAFTQAGFYEDLKVVVDKKVTQKDVDEKYNATTTRALEGGYMNTMGKVALKRNSSIHFTDAISVDPYNFQTRFNNNLGLATKYAKDNGLNVQRDAKKIGLMPFQSEQDTNIKIYSLTVDLERVGRDENYPEQEASPQEKADRVNSLLTAVEELELIVKGSLDNAEPFFIAGGIGRRKTHVFHRLIKVKDRKALITQPLLDRLETGEYSIGIEEGGDHKTVTSFFKDLREGVKKYYGVD